MLSVSWEHLSSLERTDGESRRQLPIGRLDAATDGRRSRSRGGRRRRRTPRRQAVSGKKNDRESAEENRRRPPPPPAAAGAGVAPRFFGGVKITSNQTFGVITSVVRGRRVSCSVALPDITGEQDDGADGGGGRSRMRRLPRRRGTPQFPDLSVVPLRGAGLRLWKFAGRRGRRLAKAGILAVAQPDNAVSQSWH